MSVQVTPKRPASFALKSGDYIVATGEGVMTALLGRRIVQRQVAAAGRQFGPFAEDAVIGITTTQGASYMVYPVDDAGIVRANAQTASVGDIKSGGKDLIVVSTAAPNNSDGRPDGTIYIQVAE